MTRRIERPISVRPRNLGPSPQRRAAFRRGLSAETRAAVLLVVKGYRILARRWQSPVGEIDIVARRRRVLIFVEVKARAAALPRRPRPGSPFIPNTHLPRSASTRCWSCRGDGLATSSRRSTRAHERSTPFIKGFRLKTIRCNKSSFAGAFPQHGKGGQQPWA